MSSFKVFLVIFMVAIGVYAQNCDDAIALMMAHQDECVQNIEGEKLYLYPEALQVKEEYFALQCGCDGEVLIPYLYEDAEGYFILCSNRESIWQCVTPFCGIRYTSRFPPEQCRRCGNSLFRRLR